MDYQRVILLGNTTDQAEVKQAKNGSDYALFSVAVGKGKEEAISTDCARSSPVNQGNSWCTWIAGRTLEEDRTPVAADRDLSRSMESGTTVEVRKMRDESKTKSELIDALAETRQRVAELEASATPIGQADTIDARLLLSSLRALRKGDFAARLPSDRTGVSGEIAGAFNDTVELASGLADELERIAVLVGKEGRTSERASIEGAYGSWGRCVRSVNTLVDDIVQPTTEIARVIEAVASGDLTQSIRLEVEGQLLQGQFLSLANTINTMVDQLSAFAAEVTRVAREVGVEGRLGGQARVEGVSGSWRDLTDNVNLMAANLTGQVRNIAEVTTAVAQGDLTRKITVEAQGEILELKNTINTMVDQLSSFADEVTRVSREVAISASTDGSDPLVPGESAR